MFAFAAANGGAKFLGLLHQVLYELKKDGGLKVRLAPATAEGKIISRPVLGWIVIVLNKRVIVGRDVGGKSQFVHDLHVIIEPIIEPIVILVVVVVGRIRSVMPILVAWAFVGAVTATAGAASAPSAAQR